MTAAVTAEGKVDTVPYRAKECAMRWFLCGIMVGCLALAGSPASAEWFADVYAGQSFTEKHTVTLHTPPGQSVFRGVEFERSLAYGGRFGRYFDAVPFLGVAVDLFNSSSPIRAQDNAVDGCVPSADCNNGRSSLKRIDIDSTSISADVMLRLPLLKTKTAPYGAIQPYVAGGIPFFITTVTPRSTAVFRNHQDDTDYSFGVKAAGGVAVHLARNLMLFGEYRYTHVQISVDDLEPASNPREPGRLRTDLDTHSALIGLSARW
jgi:opacity protein-like surface antigen